MLIAMNMIMQPLDSYPKTEEIQYYLDLFIVLISNKWK